MRHTYAPRKVTFLAIFTFLTFISISVAQVGINTLTPSPGSILDIDSSDKGLLIPRVNISNLSTIAPITGGSTESLLVYNTNTTTGKGFHFWTGTQWLPIDADWKKTGNAGTSPSTDFIGTTDNQALVFKTNDAERMRITSPAGQLLIGKTTPGSGNDLLQVLSDIEIGGGSSAYDYTSENIQMTARSQEWNINVLNNSSASNSTFYIGTSESGSSAALTLAPNGDVKVGINNDAMPLAELHVAKDQDNAATTIMLDNTSTVNDIPHTAVELWDGSTYLKGFIRHNNKTNIMQIGHAEDDGIVEFFSGDGSGSNSAVSMTLENDSSVTIESLLTLKPRSTPSSPSEGDIYYDSTSKRVRVYNGTSWRDMNN